MFRLVNTYSSSYSSSVLRIAVLEIARVMGFHMVRESALETLVDLLDDFLRSLTRVAKSTAEHTKRTNASLFDALEACSFHALSFPDLLVALVEGLNFQCIREEAPIEHSVSATDEVWIASDSKGQATSSSSSDSRSLSSVGRLRLPFDDAAGFKPAFVPRFLPEYPDRHTYQRSLNQDILPATLEELKKYGVRVGVDVVASGDALIDRSRIRSQLEASIHDIRTGSRSLSNVPKGAGVHVLQSGRSDRKIINRFLLPAEVIESAPSADTGVQTRGSDPVPSTKESQAQYRGLPLAFQSDNRLRKGEKAHAKKGRYPSRGSLNRSFGTFDAVDCVPILQNTFGEK